MLTKKKKDNERTVRPIHSRSTINEKKRRKKESFDFALQTEQGYREKGSFPLGAVELYAVVAFSVAQHEETKLPTGHQSAMFVLLLLVVLHS